MLIPTLIFMIYSSMLEQELIVRKVYLCGGSQRAALGELSVGVTCNVDRYHP